MVVVGRNPPNRGGAKAADVRGLVDPCVHFGGSVNDEAASLRIGETFATDVPRRLGAPSDDEGDDVRHVATADENTVPLSRESEEFRQPANALVLYFRRNRRERPRTAIWIDGGREQVGE